MTEHLISHKTSILSKEMGCTLERCVCGGFPECVCVDKKITLSLLQKWIREEHNIQMIMKPFYDSLSTVKCKFVCDVIEIKGTGRVIKSHQCDTYEEALEEGLVNGLNLIKQLKI